MNELVAHLDHMAGVLDKTKFASAGVIYDAARMIEQQTAHIESLETFLSLIGAYIDLGDTDSIKSAISAWREAKGTPRTDAVAGSDPMCDGHWDQPQIVELASLARQLKRELAEARAKLREAMKYVQHQPTCLATDDPDNPAHKVVPCKCGLDALKGER